MTGARMKDWSAESTTPHPQPPHKTHLPTHAQDPLMLGPRFYTELWFCFRVVF